MINIKVENGNVLALFAKIRQRTGNLEPLMANIAGFLRRSVIKNFDAGGRPNPWPVSKRAVRDGGRATLTDTGRLKNSIAAFATNNTAEVGTNVEYAPFLQFGTRPYDIRPINKKALFWPGAGHPVKGVHNPGLPPRPFMMVQDNDWEIIRQLAADFLTGA